MVEQPLLERLVTRGIDETQGVRPAVREAVKREGVPRRSAQAVLRREPAHFGVVPAGVRVVKADAPAEEVARERHTVPGTVEVGRIPEHTPGIQAQGQRGRAPIVRDQRGRAQGVRMEVAGAVLVHDTQEVIAVVVFGDGHSQLVVFDKPPLLVVDVLPQA